MFEGHDLYLVALSVAIAILGGYNGFALAARIRRRPDASRRVLLAGAAAFLAVGIWTMHFIGMLAAPLPPETAYLVLPTVVSFLICALVVGVSLFFVSIGPPAWPRVAGSAVLVEGGICTMHYVGMHGLSGPFEMQHDPLFVILSALIAIGAAFGGLRAFLAGQGGIQLVFSASEPWILQRRRPRRPAVSRLPVEGADGVHFIEAAEVRSIRADAHYTRVHDGTRERMCLSSISKAETQLDPDLFLRVHRSHIVALSHVILVRREGDGAVIELNGAATQRVPVSRAWGETGRQPRGRAVRPQHVPEQGHHGYFRGTGPAASFAGHSGGEPGGAVAGPRRRGRAIRRDARVSHAGRPRQSTDRRFNRFQSPDADRCRAPTTHGCPCLDF